MKPSNGATSIVARSANDWELVNARLDDFADGIVREIGVRAGEHVDPVVLLLGIADLQARGLRRDGVVEVGVGEHEHRV
jgi:hypothetical protein